MSINVGFRASTQPTTRIEHAHKLSIMCMMEFGCFRRTSEYEGAELSLRHRYQTEPVPHCQGGETPPLRLCFGWNSVVSDCWRSPSFRRWPIVKVEKSQLRSGAGLPRPDCHIVVYPNEIWASCRTHANAYLTISVNAIVLINLKI